MTSHSNQSDRSDESDRPDPLDQSDQSDQAAAWYVCVNDQELGPVKLADLAGFVRKGQLRRSDLVWRRGSEAWITAGQVAGLFPPPASPALPAKHASSPVAVAPVAHVAPVPAQVVPAPGKRRNYFARHWRGELSLPVSYWINTFLGNIAVAFAIELIGLADPEADFNPAAVLGTMVLVWAILLVVVSWQLVGIWRSAARYAVAHPTRRWGGVAKAMVALAALRVVVSFVLYGAPQIGGMYEIYAGDAQVGKYAFRVLRDGQELEFSGGITFGAAKEFARFVDAMAALKVVHLYSPGGRLLEAQRIGDLIRQHKLSTYVDDRCLSACTIVFLSGRERFISDEAVLGFHQPDFPGLTDEQRRDAVAAEESRLRRLGVSAAFARKANAAPPDDMWFPSAAELVSERVVTRVVSRTEFAVSGLDPAATDDVVDRALSGDLYVALRRVDPDAYARVRAILQEGLRRGASINDLNAQIYPIMVDPMTRLRPYASEQNLLDTASFMARLLAFLTRDDATACYFYLFPRKATSDAVQRALERNPQLRDEGFRLMAQVFREHAGTSPPLPARASVTPTFDRVMAILRTRGAATDIMNNDELQPAQYAPFCTAFAALFEETLKLPRDEAVPFLRLLFDGARSGLR